MRKTKYIGGFGINNKTVEGNYATTETYVRNDGVIDIHKYMIDKPKVDYGSSFREIKTMFGKSVYMQVTGFRYETMKAILHYSQEIMIDYGVTLKDLK